MSVVVSSADEIRAWPQNESGWHVSPNGDRVTLGNDVKLGDRVTLGDWVTLGDRVKLGDGVKVPPNTSSTEIKVLS